MGFPAWRDHSLRLLSVVEGVRGCRVARMPCLTVVRTSTVGQHAVGERGREEEQIHRRPRVEQTLKHPLIHYLRADEDPFPAFRGHILRRLHTDHSKAAPEHKRKQKDNILLFVSECERNLP